MASLGNTHLTTLSQRIRDRRIMLPLLSLRNRKRSTMMAASNFEFKYRFWLFCALFGTAFSAYGIDQEPAGIAIGNWIARLPGTAATNMNYHVVFAIGALFCLAASLVRTWATAYLKSEVMVG